MPLQHEIDFIVAAGDLVLLVVVFLGHQLNHRAVLGAQIGGDADFREYDVRQSGFGMPRSAVQCYSSLQILK